MRALCQQLESSWLAQLSDQFDQPYWHQLEQFLAAQLQAQKIIYPAENDVFNALNSTSYKAVKVVILGQARHVAGQPMLRHELGRLEVGAVLGVLEHLVDRGLAFMCS